MLERLKVILMKIIVQLRDSVKRFPETLMISATMVVIAIVLNHTGTGQDEWVEMLERILMSLSLGLPLSAALKLMYERGSVKWFARGRVDFMAFMFLVIFYFLMPETLDQTFMIRYFVLNVMLYLAFTMVPYFYKRKNYSIYFLVLVTRFFITYLYAMVLYAGISGMLATVDLLFELDIDSKLYLDIFIVVSGIFAIAYFLGSIPTYDDELGLEDYSKVFHTLFLYIVLPLIAAYTAILYAYFIKIVIQWEWPEGLIGNLVVWYGLICTIVVFFIHPLRREKMWVRRFLKIFPIVILLPMGMLFYAIGIRIGEYGITVPRYFVVVIAVWIVGNMLYIFFTKHCRTIFVTLSALILMFVSVYGPINAFAISKWDQNNRLEQLLADYGMLQNGEIVKASEELNQEQKDAVNELIRYFDSRFELSDARVLPDGFELDQMEEVFGFKYEPKYYWVDRDYIWEDWEYINYYYEDWRGMIVDVSDHDYMVDFQYYVGSEMEAEYGDLEVSHPERSKVLTVLLDGDVIYRLNMDDLAAEYHEMRQGIQPETVEEIMITHETDKVTVTFVILNMYAQKAIGTDQVELNNMEARMFIQIK